MKCSDCAFWKTDGCKNNPEGTDYNYAEDFACFVHDPDAKARRVAAGMIAETDGEETYISEQLPKSALRSGGWLAIIGMLGALGVWIWMTTSSGRDWDDWMIATIPLAIFGILVFVGWLAVLNNKKGRLPTLTRIAVGIILVASALVIVWALVGIIMSPSPGFGLFFLPWWLFLHLPIAPAVFLAFKEKWAWVAAIAAFALAPIVVFPLWHFSLNVYILYPICTIVLPLIFVILDRKKYWKMAEEAKVPPDEPAEQ